MTHEQKIAQWIGPGKVGTEIGAGASPVPGLEPPPIYVDCFKSFGSAPNLADYYGHACRLPFHDHSLDYVIASHVLEHVANPVAALAEWYRVVQPGGILYLIVPNRRSTFDQTRDLTPVDHLMNDYLAGTTACDPTHIDEFCTRLDWKRFEPDVPDDEIPERRKTYAEGLHQTVRRGDDINIHFHTFEPSTVRELVERLARPGGGGLRALATTPAETASSDRSAFHPGPASLPRLQWELLDLVDGFPASTPNGVLAVIQVNKGWRARADAATFRIRNADNPRAVLRPDAQPFREWAARTPGLGGVQ